MFEAALAASFLFSVGIYVIATARQSQLNLRKSYERSPLLRKLDPWASLKEEGPYYIVSTKIGGLILIAVSLLIFYMLITGHDPLAPDSVKSDPVSSVKN